MKSSNKQFFETAYRTGTDVWTHTPIPDKAHTLTSKLKKHSLVLDLGSGRGRIPFEFTTLGLRVIGVDYVSEIVTKNNQEVVEKKIGERLRFVEADVLDLPFTDAGFDAVMDVGLLEHLPEESFSKYASEVSRMIKPSGYFYLLTLSRETTHFFTWRPKESDNGSFEQYGLSYHFFTKEELEKIFASDFVLESEKIINVTSGVNPASYIEILLKKK